MKSLQERYNSIYAQHKTTYGSEPFKLVEEATQYITTGEVLDVGAGDGRNAFYLASKDFTVTAVDISEVGLSNLKQALDENGLQAELIADDIRTMQLHNSYDLIISTFVLFHFLPDEAVTLIKKLQDHTTINGVHVLATFTKDCNFYQNSIHKNGFYPEPGELEHLYENWEILKCKKVGIEVRDKKADGSRIANTATILMARKLEL